MNEDQILKDKPGGNIVVQIVYRYLPYWPILVLFTVATMTAAYLYLRSQTPIYVASAKVLLKDPQNLPEDLLKRLPLYRYLQKLHH